MKRTYIAIDLKSFYASVECMERGLDPLTTNLVVADLSRTEKTICLAVSPSLKSYGISGRARLFEVVQRVTQVNNDRRRKAPSRQLTGKSYSAPELKADAALAVDYIVAKPQMARYMEMSAGIYGIYLKYVAPEDIFAYSIDEVFIDATGYLKIYRVDAHDFARMLVQDVLKTTGITATAGIGPNLYLCKIAMDIVAKHIPPDENGVRIASIDEHQYKEKLWDHRPITDFWRVGRGTAERLTKYNIHTMGDIALWSTDRKRTGLLYDILGKNAELLIDHAWGVEPTTIADVKAYKPESNSISSGQVLKQPTPYEHTKLIVWEMADKMSLDLVAKRLVTDRLVLTIGYDRANIDSGEYEGEVTIDRYGRSIPKHAHGTINLPKYTLSTKSIIDATMELFERIIDRNLTVRRLTLAACDVLREEDVPKVNSFEQISIFDMERSEEDREHERAEEQKERALQEAMIEIKQKFGKNAVIKAKNLEKGGTAIERNQQIGGHRA